MAEHRLNLDGVSDSIFSVDNGGKNVTVSGWDTRHHNWKEGDMFILQGRSGEGTRYQADKIERPGDPNDQYFMYMTFKPRVASNSDKS